MLSFISELIQEQVVLRNLVSTLVLLASVLILRFSANRGILNHRTTRPEDRRRWLRVTRSTSLLILGLGITVIWAEELRAFAVSLVAVAAAMVIAVKELLLCIMGGVFKASTLPFRIGDRISLKGVRGDVSDHNFFSTTLLEIGPDQKGHQYTGRKISLPNSVFLSEPIINESLVGKSSFHTFTLPIEGSQVGRWKSYEESLLEIANELNAPFSEEIAKQFSRLEAINGVSAPNITPRVTVQVPSPNRLELILRVPALVPNRGKMEQAILRKFLSKNPDYLEPASSAKK